jgi:phage-related protein
MTRWVVDVIDAAERELLALPEDLQAHFTHIAEMLQENGPRQVSEPHVRHLQAKLWEMRLRGQDGIARAIYFAATGRRLVVVRIFIKKTRATPRREIALALRRMAEIR